jgi:mutator protein MutT
LTRTGKTVHVAAAVLLDSCGRILIAQRPHGSHLAGGWEFPGGKLESGERPLEALARELREELGIEMGRGPHRPLRRVRHSYPDRDILIEAWVVREYTGDPHGLDGQNIRWCMQSELVDVPLLPADAPIIASLKLPERLVCTPTDDYSIGFRTSGKMVGTECSDVTDALAAEEVGVDFVVMTAWLPNQLLSELCQAVEVPVFALGIDLQLAWVLGATGVNQLDAAQVTD